MHRKIISIFLMIFMIGLFPLKAQCDEDAENVLISIATYSEGSIKKLKKNYGNETAILNALKEYKHKKKYHGHRSVKKDEGSGKTKKVKSKREKSMKGEFGISDSAKKNLKLALKYLNDGDTIERFSQAKKKKKK